VSNRNGGTVAVVPAGGLGRRMGAALPKQFLDLGGKPILIRTLEKLERCPDVDFVIVVVPAELVDRARETIDAYPVRKVVRIVPGGAERQDSVHRGLLVLPAGAELVLVHDAVRPFVTVRKISESIAAARECGAAILAVSSRNTMKQVENGWVVRTLDRTLVWQVQTPQVFKTDWILEAYEKAQRDGFRSTDDSLLVERMGYRVKVVLGEETNIKITTKADLVQAEALVETEEDRA